MTTKIAIIGSGFVGSTCAYSLFNNGVTNEIALIDVYEEKAKGEALDIKHGNIYTSYTKITHGNSYELCKDASIIVITAGSNRKSNESRLDLTKKNAIILKSIITEIQKYNNDAILLIVSNPIDILVYLAQTWSNFPKNKIFGTGTSLDTARFKQNLSDHYNINPNYIHAYILGEHGESQFPVWSSANIAGIKLNDFENYNKEKLDNIFLKTKNDAIEIINAKGSTYYAIGLVVKDIVKSILNDQYSIYPISTFIEDYYGVNNVCLSIPCVLSKKGIYKKIYPILNENEQEQLKKSANQIKKHIQLVINNEY